MASSTQGKVFAIVENGKLIQYRRIGSCNACGECCCTRRIHAEFTSALASDGDETRNVEVKEGNDDWSEWEGWSAHRQYGLWWWWKFATEDKAKTCGDFVNGKCELWDSEEFPALCRDWPVHPSDLEHFPNCEFHFEKAGK